MPVGAPSGEGIRERVRGRRYRGGSDGLVDTEASVALDLEGLGQLGPARLADASGHEDVHRSLFNSCSNRL